MTMGIGAVIQSPFFIQTTVAPAVYGIFRHPSPNFLQLLIMHSIFVLRNNRGKHLVGDFGK
jgi:hypothetical protein